MLNKIHTLNKKKSYPVLKNEISFEPLIYKDSSEILYKHVVLSKFVASCKNIRNKYFLSITKEIFSVKNIVKRFDGSIILEVTKYENMSLMFNRPLPSNDVFSFYVNTTTETIIFYIEPNKLKLNLLTERIMSIFSDF